MRDEYALDTVLREQLGFTGFVITDFGAIHSTAPSIVAGTDMETGTASFYDGALLAAVQSGEVPVSLVDRSVLRILRTMFAIGVFDNDYTPTAIPVEEHGAVAREVEEDAITLLQNDGDVLPLDPAVGSIAVIGGDANIPSALGGSAYVQPTYTVSLVDALTARGRGDRRRGALRAGQRPGQCCQHDRDGGHDGRALFGASARGRGRQRSHRALLPDGRLERTCRCGTDRAAGRVRRRIPRWRAGLRQPVRVSSRTHTVARRACRRRGSVGALHRHARCPRPRGTYVLGWNGLG